MPKAAGTSVRLALERHFGAHLKLDYADRPMRWDRISEDAVDEAAVARSSNRGRDFGAIRCIHGHFLPSKYGEVPGAVFVTWLRDPVDRVVSHYHHVVRTMNRQQPGPLAQRIMQENWDVERFCLSDELRNIYTRLFLRDFPVERFAFVGIAERFEQQFQSFARTLGADLPMPPRANVATYSRGIAEDLRARIAAWHADDVELYRRWGR
jgi:hypothetical protein